MTEVNPQKINIGRRILRKLKSISFQVTASTWKPYSRLFLVGDNAPWVLAWELRELAAIATRLGIHCPEAARLKPVNRQSVFYATIYSLLAQKAYKRDWRLGVSIYHGRPGTGEPAFEERFEGLRCHHHRIDRIQVTNRAFREIILETGIAPEKVFIIPIGINPSFFFFQTPEAKRKARDAYGLPQAAAIVGSFQKDGDGWGEGMEPKRVKGPDVFLKAIEILKDSIPELFVLLSGPARGYIKAGLERKDVPYKHIYLQEYPDIGQLYQCLDAYLVTSRDEGGPKAVLESMASGVPIVSTKVGQAADLVSHGENGWLCELEDAEALAHWTQYALLNQKDNSELLAAGLKTAEANTYEELSPLWRDFMRGFVHFPEVAANKGPERGAP